MIVIPISFALFMETDSELQKLIQSQESKTLIQWPTEIQDLSDDIYFMF